MSATAQAILGSALPLAVPLLLAAAELMSMRRGGSPPDPTPPPLPTTGQKPLPECLIPKVGVKGRERLLELV